MPPGFGNGAGQSQHPGAQVAGRLGGVAGSAQGSRELARFANSRGTDFTAAIKVGTQFGFFGIIERAYGVQGVIGAELVAGHAGTPPPNSWRICCRARRIQLFTVPSGWRMRSAISLCDRPSK